MRFFPLLPQASHRGACRPRVPSVLFLRPLGTPVMCCSLLVVTALCLASTAAEPNRTTAKLAPAGPVVMKVVMVEDEDGEPAAAGKTAAEALKQSMGDVPLRAVVVSECFEDQPNKERLLQGLTSVLPKQLVFGAATYGSFTQEGCTDFDAVCLLGIGGEGISAAASLVTEMGTSELLIEEHPQLIEARLTAAGAKLVRQLQRSAEDRLLILMADAHSPKNEFLVAGAQKVLGPRFPITGGSANKNAGQTFVYFRGQPYRDSAVALMLSGDFHVALAGRKAQDNDAVIRTAEEAAAEALARLQGKPTAALAFDCAGRRGKLDHYEDELAAIQAALGKRLPLFGCYCAGEVGPLDPSEAKPGIRCGGSGWHVMVTILGK